MEKETTERNVFCTATIFDKLVTARDGVAKLGYTSLVVVDPQVQLDQTYYCDLLLSQLAISQVSDDFILHETSAPAYTECWFHAIIFHKVVSNACKVWITIYSTKCVKVLRHFVTAVFA